MIESGSCCALLADTLTQLHKDLTIITNSAFIAEYIRGKSNFQIILLGGIYQQDSQVMVGPMVQECVSNFLSIIFSSVQMDMILELAFQIVIKCEHKPYVICRIKPNK